MRVVWFTLPHHSQQVSRRPTAYIIYAQVSPWLPVNSERVGDCFGDDLAVLLQGVQGVLDCLVDGLLHGATHLLNLVHTATRLHTATQGHSQPSWEYMAFYKKSLISNIFNNWQVNENQHIQIIPTIEQIGPQMLY